MNLTIVPVGLLGTNCYLAADDDGACAVVDPGAAPDKLTEILEEKKLTPKVILLTHGHHDHIGGVKSLKARFPDLQIYIGAGDAELLLNPEKSYAAQRGRDAAEYTFAQGDFSTLGEGDTLTVGELTIGVVETPGHTRGGVCYLCGDVMFSGDTLFREDCGRCDLYGGDFEVMKQSLQKLAGLEGDYTVYPGHDRSTTLDHERGNNPYLRG